MKEMKEMNTFNIIKKYIFDVNTFKFKSTLRCKLISDNTYAPTLSFKCSLVIEAGYRAFFEIPFIYNITTFEVYKLLINPSPVIFSKNRVNIK